MKRIAIGGISTENCTFTALPTRLSDFVICRDADLLAGDRYPFLDRYDALFLPTLQANALPGGQVERAAYDRLKAEFLQRLVNVMPIDGLYLDLHGAMYVDGMLDAELDLVRTGRNARLGVAAGVPVAAVNAPLGAGCSHVGWIDGHRQRTGVAKIRSPCRSRLVAGY